MGFDFKGEHNISQSENEPTNKTEKIKKNQKRFQINYFVAAAAAAVVAMDGGEAHMKIDRLI